MQPRRIKPLQKSPVPDLVRVARAVATNQLARLAPAAYVRLTGQTGRGAEAESAGDVAAYFRQCIAAYLERLAAAAPEVRDPFAGRTLLEYGPGDVPGVAALMVARGANKVYCVDRFPMLRLDRKNATVIADLGAGLDAPMRARFEAALLDPADPMSGFDASRIEYIVNNNGTSGLAEQVDLVYSRAVLEHVNDLDATLHDMVRAMRPGALAIHLVDLRSHGLHRENPLDFLCWSPWLWEAMYSAKGVPNRWRIDRYREVLVSLPVDLLALEVTVRAAQTDVGAVRPRLAAPFRRLSDEDLASLGFWLVFRKRDS